MDRSGHHTHRLTVRQTDTLNGCIHGQSTCQVGECHCGLIDGKEFILCGQELSQDKRNREGAK